MLLNGVRMLGYEVGGGMLLLWEEDARVPMGAWEEDSRPVSRAGPKAEGLPTPYSSEEGGANVSGL